MMRKQKYLAVLGLLAGMVLAMSGMVFAAEDVHRDIRQVKITVSNDLAQLDTDQNLPNISASDFSVGNESMYEITDAMWSGINEDTNLPVGSQPRIRLVLSPKSQYEAGVDKYIYYRFRGAYSAGNVKVNNAVFVSASRKSEDELDVTIKLKGVRGTYTSPDEAYWKSQRGLAYWSVPTVTSGYYQLRLMRNGRTVETFKTRGNKLNLYPWMDREGEYSFDVKTIPYTDAQTRYGEASEFISSDTLYLNASEVSDGSGKYDPNTIKNGGNAGQPEVNGTTEAGWIENNGRWYFRYPNGQFLKNQWLGWKERWYRLSESGAMVTGWYKDGSGNWFYLNQPNGEMLTGWIQAGSDWYFLNTTKGSSEGAMLKNVLWNVNGRLYYFGADGRMQTGWIPLKDAQGQTYYYYFYPQNRVEGSYGYMATNTRIDGFYVDGSGRWLEGR